MAQFGTIHDWLDYDSIRMAGVTKEMANIVGKSIGAASVLGGEVVDQAFRNYETKKKGSSMGDDETSLMEEDQAQPDNNTESSGEENEHDGDPHSNLTETPGEVSNKVSKEEAYKNRDKKLYRNLTFKEFWAEANRQKNGGKVPTEQMKGSLNNEEEGEEDKPTKIENLFPYIGGRIVDNFFQGKEDPNFQNYNYDPFDQYGGSRRINTNLSVPFYGQSTKHGKITTDQNWEGFRDLRKLKRWFTGGHDTTINTDSNSLLKEPPTKRLNFADSPNKTPFPRLSPLGRYKETPLNQMQDMLEYGTISEASMPDYLGSIGKAAEQGYNRAIEKFNYNLRVQKERLKGINEQYSSLKVDPTGLSSLDANLKILGKGMQGAYMELMSKKNSMNSFDFMQEKQKLLEQPVIINQAIKTLQQRVKDFNDNRYEVAQATDSRTIDILDTLSKGGGDLKPIYKDGVPYLVGTTLGGKNVDVAISEIANGNNDFKFIKSETVQPFIDDIIKDYTATEKYYTEGGGIMERKKLRSGWEQVATSKFKEDLKMKGEPGMRGYAALFGTNFDGYNKMLEQGEDIEGFLVDSFLNRVNQEFQPYAQAVQTGQLRPKTASTTQSERDIAITKAKLDKKGNITKDNYEEFLILVKDFQENYIARVENGILQIADNKTGDIRTNIDLSKPSLAKQKLANLAGVTGYQGGQQQFDATSLIQKYSK